MNDRLRGRVAVVTGAARGIGRAAAVAMAREGADIAGIDICAVVDPQSGVSPATPDDLRQTGQQIEATGRRWVSIICDQRDVSALRAAAARVVEELGAIDILFANAGTQGFQSLLEMDDAHWRVHVDVNLTGTANAIRAFAPHIVRQGRGGRIIVTTSTQGRHGTLHGAAYSATKWGIIGLMKSAALELGRYGITVNALVPGLIDTPLTRHEARYAQALAASGKHSSGSDTDGEAARKILAASSPLGVPWIEPEDVAPVVVFLASDEARMVSGATYDATAGDSAHYTA